MRPIFNVLILLFVLPRFSAAILRSDDNYEKPGKVRAPKFTGGKAGSTLTNRFRLPFERQSRSSGLLDFTAASTASISFPI
jgi:hypothetical protein